VTGVLAQWAPAPTVTPFVVHGVLSVLAVIPFALIMSSQIVSVGVCFFLYLFILASVMHYLNTAYADSLIARYMREGEEDSDA
jgi:hypothetical protein